MIVYGVQSRTKHAPQRPVAANREISFAAQQGEIFGILGDRGAGKSTLARQMVNRLQPTAGAVSLARRPVHADSLRAPRLVGYMPQDGLALNNLTVGAAFYFTSHCAA